MKREDFYASPFGVAYSAYMERPLLSRLIGRAVWGGDSKPYYESMGAIAEVPEGGVIVDCPCRPGRLLSGQYEQLRPDAVLRCSTARPRRQGDAMKPALLFDLDETLMVEEPAVEEAFRAAAQAAAGRCDIAPDRLAEDVRTRARELWNAAPTHDYCMHIGISSWEGLWCRFEGSAPEVRALRGWSPEYRREAWRLVLADQGVDDAVLAEELGERFAAERRARHEVFADVKTSLSR